MRLFIFF